MVDSRANDVSEPAVLYVDMDGVICDIMAGFRAARENEPDLKRPQKREGFFLNLPAIDGAIESVEKLREHFDVYILSAPSTRNPHSYSEKRIWIEQHFGYEFTKKLILSPNKGLSRGRYLIDDFTSGKGQESFEGELIHFGSDQFPDWPSVLAYLDVERPDAAKVSP